MPRGDGTGPAGTAPRAGKNAGTGRRCTGARGPSAPTECLCPKCGTRTPHERGVPCTQQKCPQCGASMVRA